MESFFVWHVSLYFIEVGFSRRQGFAWLAILLADMKKMVILHMIQAYEQGDQNIMKADARTVFALAKVLECASEVICW